MIRDVSNISLIYILVGSIEFTQCLRLSDDKSIVQYNCIVQNHPLYHQINKADHRLPSFCCNRKKIIQLFGRKNNKHFINYISVNCDIRNWKALKINLFNYKYYKFGENENKHTSF